MKILLLISLCLTTMPIYAEDIPRPLLIQTERFTLPQMEAYELLQANLSDSNLRQEMLKRVAAKTARLEQFLMLRAISGQRSKVQQVDEFPYATDFESGKVPNALVLADAAGAVMLPAVEALIPPLHPPPLDPSVQGAPKPTPPAGPFHNAGIGLQTTPAPTKMNVRYLGDFLEVDTTLTADGKAASVRYSFETVHYLGDIEYNGTSQPKFRTQKVNATSSMKHGRPVFLGTCSKAVLSGVEHGQEMDELSLQFMTVFITEPLQVKPPLLPETNVNNKPVKVHLEVISLPQHTAYALMTAHTDDAVSLNKLHAMIASQTATLEASEDIKAASGELTEVKQIKPYSYPTEFPHHLIPDTLTITDPSILDILHLHSGGSTPDPDNLSQAIITISTPDPATFQTREVGFTGIIQPVLLSDGEHISISFMLDLVRYLGDRNLAGSPRPVFEWRAINTSALLTRNVPMLLGTMGRPQSTGAPGGNLEQRVSLAFVTATTD